jgi:hypothetical protein
MTTNNSELPQLKNFFAADISALHHPSTANVKEVWAGNMLSGLHDHYTVTQLTKSEAQRGL